MISRQPHPTNVSIVTMSLRSFLHALVLPSLMLAGAAFLGDTPLARGGPEDSASADSVVAGRVFGLAEGQHARVEVRLLEPRGGVPGASSTCGEAELGGSARWLASRVADGEALRAVSVEGPSATFRVVGLPAGTYELGLVQDDEIVWRTPAVLEVDGQHVEADLSVPTGDLHLRVRLRWSDGRPFRGLVVVEQPERGLKARPYLSGARQVETDERGLIEVASLHRGACELTAVVPDRLRVRGKPLELPQDEIHVWTLEEGSPAIGTVVSGSDRQPVVGAVIRAHATGDGKHEYVASRTQTDERGMFRVPRGHRETEISIVADGLAPAFVRLRANDAVGTVALQELATIEGFVRSGDGTPLANVVVRAEPRWTFYIVRAASEVRTTAEGRYRIAVPPGETRIRVHDERWISPYPEDSGEGWFDPMAVQVGAGATCRFDLIAVPTARLRGRVVDGEGAGLPGALVRLQWHDEPNRIAVSRADGTFALAGVPGRSGRLRVERPGFRSTVFDDARFSADGDPAHLVLDAGVRFAVRVLSGDAREPVVGARVRASQITVIERGTDPNAPTRFGPGDTYVRASTWSREERHSHAPDAWTDTDGRALVGPIAPGRVDLRIEAPGFVPVKQSIELEPSTTVEVRLESVMLPPLLAIQGRVEIPAGIEMQQIDVRRTGPDEPLQGSWGKSGGILVPFDAGGLFRIPDLEGGRYGIRATAWAEGRGYFVQTSALAGETEVELRLAPAPWMTKPPEALALRGTEDPDVPAAARTWSFRVVGPEGEPVTGGWVTAEIRRGEGEGERTWWFRGGRLEVPAEPEDEAAEFWFYGAHDDCGVRLPYGFARVGPVKAGGPPVEVVLPAEVRLHGAVLGPDGRGVRGVRVHAHPLGTDASWSYARTALTRGDGGFTLGGLAPGADYMVSSDVPPWAAPQRPVRVEADAIEWGDPLMLRLREAVAPRIRVLDPSGSPLTNAEMRIEPDADDAETFRDNVVLETFYSGPGWVIERTDAKGYGAFTRLDPGRGYVLRIDPPMDRPDLAPFYHAAWRPTAAQEIRLAPWTSLSGVVQDPSGAPVENAVIWIKERWLEEWQEGGTTDAEGKFALKHVLPGDVSLLATRSDAYPLGEAFETAALHTRTDAGPVVLHVAR